MKNVSIKNIAQKIALVSATAGLSLGLINSASAADESFNASMTLLAPITITETNALSFANTESGQLVDVTTAALDSTAAQFTSTGEPSTAVTGSVVETNINMTTGTGDDSTKQIVVDTWTFGGDMNGSGVATYDGSGDLSNLRVGATAHVEAEDIAGAYSGAATFRVTYN